MLSIFEIIVNDFEISERFSPALFFFSRSKWQTLEQTRMHFVWIYESSVPFTARLHAGIFIDD